MSIEAMKLALEALENSKPSNAGGMLDAEAMNELWHAHYAAINALRTAMQQAEAKTDEPIYQICKADSVSIHSAWVDVDKQAYDDAGLYPEYERRMLYTPPRSWCAG